MAVDQTVDVAAVVREIEAEVARRRAAGEYPEALLATLREELGPIGADEPAEVLATIQTVRPIACRTTLVGPLVVNAKRALRRLMSWYVQPMAQDQTSFNTAILRDVRDLEARVSRCETPWARGAASPPFAAGVAAERAASLLHHLAGAGGGPIEILGADERLLAALADARPGSVPALPDAVATAAAPARPLDRLEAAPPRSLAAVVLAGVLPRLAPAELLTVMGSAARALRPGGLVVTDLPDPAQPGAPRDPSSVDVAMQRWVTPETALLLCEAAGLDGDRADTAADAPGWYTVVARRR